MIFRAASAALLVAAASLTIAAGAGGDLPRTVSSYYAAHEDVRRCAAPRCGGVWVHLVNRSQTPCGHTRRRECYAADADLSRLHVGARRRSALGESIRKGRALARGQLVRGLVPGAPALATLVVTEVWVASNGSKAPGRGTLVHRLKGNLVVCVSSPCYSFHAAEMNGGPHVDVSAVDLGRTRASPAEQMQALALITTTTSLLAAGHVVTKKPKKKSRAGEERTFVATQFWERAPG